MNSGFISPLKKLLTQPLPGAKAQQLMAPAHRLSSEHYLRTVTNYRKSSVLILLHEKNNQFYFTLTLRQSYDGVHSGQVSFPGGKVDDTDLNHIATALREANEEIGIPPESIEIIGELTQLYIPPSNFLVMPVVGFCKEIPHFKKSEKEVAEIIDVATSVLLDPSNRQYKIMDLSRGTNADDLKTVNVPYFNIYGHHVWGATAMILSEFAEILKQISPQNI